MTLTINKTIDKAIQVDKELLMYHNIRIVLMCLQSLRVRKN